MMIKYKVRRVVLGCRQIAGGLDYDESQLHAPTALQASVRTLLTCAAEHNLEVHQTGGATAFLYGELQEDAFVRSPPEFAAQTHSVETRNVFVGIEASC